MNESQTITKKYSELDESGMNSLRRSQPLEISQASVGSMSVADKV